MVEKVFVKEYLERYFWMFIIVAGMALFLVILPFLYNKSPEYARAVGTTFTVCASGCDFTTITDAFATSTLATGDTVRVNSTYVAAGETFPLTFPTSTLTLDCQNSGAVIGTVGDAKGIIFTAGSIIQNCSFLNVSLKDNGSDTPGVSISNNTFSTSTYSNVSLNSGSDGSTINNNTGLMSISTGADTTAITSNTIQIYATSTYNGIDVLGSSGNTITNNIVESYLSPYYRLFTAETGVSNTSISTNTFEYKLGPTNAPFDIRAVWIKVSTNTVFSGNYLVMPATTQGGSLLSVGGGDPGQINNLTITNNTFVYTEDNDQNGDISGITVARAGSGSDTVNISYNIFVNKSTSADGRGINLFAGTAGSLAVTEAYNGYYNIASNYWDNGSSESVALAATSKTSDPYFMTGDASTANDYHLAPYSTYLDVDGTRDVGAYTTANRATSFTIDDNGTIDYSNVHATSTSVFLSVLRNGDTINLAAGTYDGFTISSSTLLNTGLTITGAGASTIINGGSVTNAITLNGIDNSTFSNFVVQNASSTSQLYAITDIAYDYGVNSYDLAGSGIYFLLYNDCDLDMLNVSADNTDITAYTNTSNWNLALMNATEDLTTNYVTAIVRDDIFPDSATVGTVCGFTVDAFVENVFTYNAGNRSFAYNSAAVAAASITLSDGYTDPPAITKTDLSYQYGIKLNNSSGNTFSSVTSTGNTYGIYFTGTAANNNFNDSVVQNSTTYDVLSDSTGNNNIKNSTFTTSKASITGAGDINVYYKARGYVINNQSSVLNGALVTFTSATSSIIATSTSLDTGYTAYSDYLLAHILDSTSTSTSNGGYNPYTVAVEATSTYYATSTTANLTSPNQTVSLTMLSGATAPSGLATSTIASTAIGLTWTDSGTGATQEDSFLLDYILTGNSFPGTTSTIAQNATSTTVTSLLPNTSYQFRIAAVNEIGTSAYSTTGGQYTNPAVPTSVVGTANGQTSIIVSWESNSNPTSTVYELYNSGTDASITTTTATSTTVTGLTASAGYIFKVRALYNSDSITWTSFSADSSETTTASVGTTVQMTLGVAVSSTFQFTGGAAHTATLNSVVEGVSANLTVASTPVTQDFSEGVADNIDTDGNGVDDMTVTVSGITATGATIALATYTPPVVSTPSPGGGGGGSVASVVPVLGTTPVTYNTNMGLSSVVLNFNVQNATQVAISDNSSFIGSSWQTYQSQKNISLNPGETIKVLYIKFRSSSGGETAAQKLTIQVNSNVFTPVPISNESSELVRVDPSSIIKIANVNRQSFVQGQYLSFKYYFTNNTGKTLPVKVTRSLVNSAGKTVLVSNATGSLKPGSKFVRSISQNLSTRLTPGVYKQVMSFYDSRTGKKIAENSFEIIVEKKKVKQAVLSGTVENTGKTIVFDTTSLKVLKKPVTLPYSFRLKYSFKNQNSPSGYFDLVREIVDENGKVWQKNTGLWKSNKGQVRNINISQTISNNLPAGNYLIRIKFSPQGKAEVAGENSFSFSVTDK